MFFGYAVREHTQVPNLKKLWAELERVCKDTTIIAATACGKFTFELYNSNPLWFRYDLIWSKNNVVGFLSANTRPLRSHENILVFSKTFKGAIYNPQKTIATKKYRVKYTKKGKKAEHYGFYNKEARVSIDDGTRYPRSVLKFEKNNKGKHSTAKPVELLEWLILTYTKEDALCLDPFAGSCPLGIAATRLNRKFIAIERDINYYKAAKKQIDLEKSQQKLF